MSALQGMLAAGGPIMVVLLALSVLSVALIAGRIVALRGVTGGEARRRAAIDAFLAGDAAAAPDPRSPADRILRAAMEGLASGRPRDALVADLEWRGNAEMTAMQRHLRLLELIAMISPLLGLLGTVLGMIQSFQDLALAEGAANAALLAGGIWQALLTTAAGLLVAIPAAVAATLLSERVDVAGARIEAAVGELLSRSDGRA